MPETSRKNERHLALPTPEELDAALAALADGWNRVERIRWTIEQFYRLEEVPADGGSGMALHADELGLTFDTFDVPTFEAIGRLAIFERHARTLVADTEEELDRLLERFDWLDVVRQAGASGTVAVDEDREEA